MAIVTVITIAIGYLLSGLFYMGAEFAFMIAQWRKEKHHGNYFWIGVMFIPCVAFWPYLAALRIEHAIKHKSAHAIALDDDGDY